MIFTSSVYSQEGGMFSFAGGPVIGYYYNNVDDLNKEIVKMGLPEISKGGFLTLGGGGYIDVPSVKGLRVGCYGLGFSDSKNGNITGTNSLINSVKYSYSYGALVFEYVKSLNENVVYTVGGAFGIGGLSIDLIKHSNQLQNWGFNGGDTINVSNVLHYQSQSYSVEPRIGIGFQLSKFLNLKINAGYSFSIQNKWKLDDVIEVKNVPSGIKAQGLNLNISLNAGIFFF